MTTAWENLLPAMQDGNLVEDKTELTELKNELKGLVLPVMKGSGMSALSSKYNNKKFKLAANEYGAAEIQFKFSKDGCSWIIKTAKGETSIPFGGKLDNGQRQHQLSISCCRSHTCSFEGRRYCCMDQ